jgi:hypothetical protein
MTMSDPGVGVRKDSSPAVRAVADIRLTEVTCSRSTPTIWPQLFSVAKIQRPVSVRVVSFDNVGVIKRFIDARYELHASPWSLA